MSMSLDDQVWDVPDLDEVQLRRIRHDLLPAVTAPPRRRTWAAPSVAAVLVVAAAVTITVLVSRPRAASAAWSAVPTPWRISATDSLVTACVAGLPSGPAADVGAGPITPVLAERRGSSRAALLGGPGSQAICVATPSSRTGGRTVSPALLPGQVLSLAGDGGALDSSGVRYVYGRVAASVTSVTVTTSRGAVVTASVAGGSYLAWWPSPAAPARVVARAASGAMITDLMP